MKKINVLSILLLVGISFSYSSIGADPDQNCGRLKTGDNFNRLNEILDCIESKINVHSSMKLENTAVYSEEKEPNDLIGNANMVALGSTIRAKINDDNEYDVFTFVAPDSKKNIRVILRQTHPSGFYPRVTVYDYTESQIFKENGRADATLSLQIKAEPKKQYYVTVTCWNGCHENMPYELHIREE
jgi:hypothetical protein